MKNVQGLIVLYLITGVISCSKKDSSPAAPGLSTKTDILVYSIKDQNLPVVIYPGLNTINITFPNAVTDASNLVANFSLSTDCIASVDNAEQTSGLTKNSYNTPFIYKVSNSKGNSTNWTVYSFNNNYTYDWGMGGFLQDSGANNRSYIWYIDQTTTGFDSSENCGPSSVTMACKWADSTFTKTAHDARMKYESQGGWWSTGDIDSYLYDNNVNHRIVSLPATAQDTKLFLKRQIDLKQVVILNIDMNYIRQRQNAYYHVDKFYATTSGWGHFFIVKGYKEVDNEMYFEIYDPASGGDVNSDGTLKGKDIYYRFEDVFKAAIFFCQYAFIIAEKGMAITENIIHSSNKNIPVQYGR